MHAQPGWHRRRLAARCAHRLPSVWSAALRVVRTPPPELGASWSLSWLKPWSADAACHEAHGAELLSGTPFNNSTGDLVSIGAFLATRLLATEMYSYTVVRVIKLLPSPPQARNFWRY